MRQESTTAAHMSKTVGTVPANVSDAAACVSAASADPTLMGTWTPSPQALNTMTGERLFCRQTEQETTVV